MSSMYIIVILKSQIFLMQFEIRLYTVAARVKPSLEIFYGNVVRRLY